MEKKFPSTRILSLLLGEMLIQYRWGERIDISLDSDSKNDRLYLLKKVQEKILS